MATFTKTNLSGSTNGAAIKVAATSSPGTLIHTPSNSPTWEEVWLWAYNSSASSVLLTVQYLGTATPDNDIKLTIAPQAGLVRVMAGLIAQNSAVAVRAYAATTNVITLSGFVNRIS